MRSGKPAGQLRFAAARERSFRTQLALGTLLTAGQRFLYARRAMSMRADPEPRPKEIA